MTSHWIGTVWGTNNGTVVADFSLEGDKLEGQILLFEPNLGQTRAAVGGTWAENGNLEVALTQFSGQLSVPMTLPKTGTLQGSFDRNQGIIMGTWSTDLGTNGRFLLAEVKANVPLIAAPAQPASGPPPPLITFTTTLGTYRLDQAAFRHLVEIVAQGTNVPLPVINAVHAGHEYIHIGVDSFFSDPNVPAAIDAVVISANEPAINQGSRTVTLNLKRSEQNILFVSGYDPVWVEGKAAQIKQFLRTHEAVSIGLVRRHGPSLNSVLFLILLGLLPSVPSLGNRLVVVAIVFALLFTLNFTWRRIANTRIFLRKDMIPIHLRYADWILAPLNLLLAGIIGYLIQKFVR